MAMMTPQQQAQQLQQCIQDCSNVINELEALAQKSTGTEISSTLKESAHHLQMCIQECSYATQAVK